MAYLTDDDYNILITSTVLDEITDGVLQNRLDAEKVAEEEIYSYLSSKYVVANEFGKSGDSRNHKIIQIYIDIVLYIIYSRKNPRNIPELRAIRYDGSLESGDPPITSAIGWMMAVKDDKIKTNLDRLPNDVGNTIKYIGNIPIDTTI